MPVRVNADQFYQVWRDRLNNSVDRIRQGVQRLTENPLQKAAARADAWIAGLQEAYQTGRWAKNVASVSLDQWKNAMLNKGVPRIQQGTAAAEDIMKDFAAQLINHLNTILPEIERMPKVTLEDSINRVTTFIRRMAEFTYIRGQGK